MPPPIRWDRTVIVRTPVLDDDPDTGNPRQTWPTTAPEPVPALRGQVTASTEDATDGQTVDEEIWALHPSAHITSRSQVVDGTATYQVVGRPVAASSYLTRQPSHIEVRLSFISDLQPTEE